VVDEERVDGEGEGDGDEPKGVQRGDRELLLRDVELPEDGHGRPRPEDVEALGGEERREHEDAQARAENADEVRAPARGRRPQRHGEEHPGDDGDRGEPLRQQRGQGGRPEDERRRDRPEPHLYSASAGTSQVASQSWRSHHSTSPSSSVTSAAPVSAMTPFT